jgi:hypothetical protein
MTGLGQAPGLGEGYGQEEGDGRHGVSGIRPGMEWTAAYDRRPARHADRWSWQNREGTVDEQQFVDHTSLSITDAISPYEEARRLRGDADELYEATSADPDLALTEVTRAEVVAALEAWIKGTHASQMGRTFGVSQPDGRRAYAEHLAAGPVAAVLEALGLTVV